MSFPAWLRERFTSLTLGTLAMLTIFNLKHGLLPEGLALVKDLLLCLPIEIENKHLKQLDACWHNRAVVGTRVQLDNASASF